MPESSEPEGQRITVIALERGQKVLLAMKETPDKIDALRIRRILKKRFPGVDFTLVTGVEGIGIQDAV